MWRDTCGENVREQITSHDPLTENKMYNLANGCVRTHKLTKSFLESRLCVNRCPTTLAKLFFEPWGTKWKSSPLQTFMKATYSLILHCFVSSYSNHYATSKQIPHTVAGKKHYHPQAFFVRFLHSVLTAIPYSCAVENVANFLIGLHHIQMVLTINPDKTGIFHHPWAKTVGFLFGSLKLSPCWRMQNLPLNTWWFIICM